MKIGLANIYSFRPHMHHLFYLEHLLNILGHDIYFLTCDSSLPNCYPRLLKGKGRLTECPKCIVGGVRSFTKNNVSSIDKKLRKKLFEKSDLVTTSSAATLLRLESDLELLTDTNAIKENLLASAEIVYANALNWIEKNDLDSVICFNGRMNEVRAITLACETAGIPYITHERPWFCDGIQLNINQNCLSLYDLNSMSAKFQNLPLNDKQVEIAADLSARRFLRANSLEWRLYNTNATNTTWPIKNTSLKVLVLPSSRNEFMGHSEWKTAWEDNTTAIDEAVIKMGLKYSDLLVRFHPNWGESIGKVKGNRSREHYKKWVIDKDIYYIDCEETADTYDLIRQADLIIVNGSSTGIEAALMGKPVICLGPSSYQGAGIALHVKTEEEFKTALDVLQQNPEHIITKALRHMYLRYGRFPQFVPYVRAKETTDYDFYEGADPMRLEQLLKTLTLQPDDEDTAVAPNPSEASVAEDFLNFNWGPHMRDSNTPNYTKIDIGRRNGFKFIDKARTILPRGDKG